MVFLENPVIQALAANQDIRVTAEILEFRVGLVNQVTLVTAANKVHKVILDLVATLENPGTAAIQVFLGSAENRVTQANLDIAVFQESQDGLVNQAIQGLVGSQVNLAIAANRDILVFLA